MTVMMIIDRGCIASIIFVPIVFLLATTNLPNALADHLTSPPINLSNTDGDSINARIAASGSNIFIVWQDSSSGNEEILFSKSSDGGETFDSEPINLSENEGASTGHQIALSGDNVYVVWQDRTDPDTGMEGSNREIFFARSTDGGDSFDEVVNLSDNNGTSTGAEIAVSGDNIYVAWTDRTGLEGISSDVFFRASTDGGDSFGEVLNLSNNTEISNDIQLAVTGINVYIVWKDTELGNGSIFYLRSSDSGATFDSDGDELQDLPANLSIDSADALSPTIAVNGSNLYVAWLGSDGLAFKRLPNEGETTDEPVEILSNDINQGFAPQLATSGTSIYAVWISGSSDILFKRLIDNGASLDFTSDSSNLTEGLGGSSEPQIAISEVGSDIYVVWEDDYLGFENTEIFFSAVSDDGVNTSVGCPIDISNADFGSSTPRLAVSGPNVYIVWEDFTPGSLDIFIASNPPFQEKSIAIDLIDNIAPRWELDSVSLSGRLVNAAPDDKVVINRGDGSTPETADISGCFWSSPSPHQYGIDSIGETTIEIDMLDGGDNSIDSISSVIQVAKHSTSLSLNAIPGVRTGEELTVTGTLLDIDSGLGIPDANVTFDGNGANTLLSVTTDQNGGFESSGAAPGSEAEHFIVQAHFTVNDAYLDSSSDPHSYDTVSVNATEIEITDIGPVTLDLSTAPYNFTGLSVEFEDVLSEGSIFVSECTPSPSNSRYSQIVEDRCYRITSGVELSPGTSMLVHVDYTGLVSDQSLIDDVDLFVESAGNMTDLTKARLVDGSDPATQVQVAIGKTSSIFGKFFLAVAEHGPKSADAARSQIFVGDGNEVLFRNHTSLLSGDAEINLDSQSYGVGDSAVITVVDPEKNLDSTEKNSLSVGVISDSDPDGITVQLEETDVDTGTFTGSFEITGSDSDANMIKSRTGEDIHVTYQPSGARIKATFDGVIESGVVQITDEVIPLEQEQSFLQTGGAFKIQPLDAQLGPDGLLSVTVSYRNMPMDESGNIFSNNPADLRLYHEEEFTQWLDITTEVNTDEMTVTGQTSSTGRFSLGFNTGGPGGCGGGCGLPGTGVVLDFTVPIVMTAADNSDDKSKGRSNGGASSSSTRQVISGTDIESEINVDQNSVIVSFDTVEPGSGQLKVSTVDISKFSDSFDQVISQQNRKEGIVGLDGSTFVTTGSIFDIDASAVKFQGLSKVTIPFDDKIAESIGSESSVRLLNYIEENNRWEDATVGLDTQNNTVTGMLRSHSPVVAAVVDDNTLPSIYFEMNPQNEIVIDDVSFTVDAPSTGRATIDLNIVNMQRAEQQYTTLVQIVDEDSITRFIDWQSGSLARGENIEISNDWIPEKETSYTIQVFAWDNIDNPSALSAVATLLIHT